MFPISSGQQAGPQAAAGPEPADSPSATVRIPGTAVALTGVVLTGVVTMTVAGVPTAGVTAAAAVTVEAVRRLYKAVKA
ncbi:hypothetical protein GCM10009839_25850 [Catenulispora yoronensis]|uniref:SpdD protein n=1 Tax=Catenulispora yoronensis TaxID=450799 RepID=A0ABP5FGN0_9ACTN